MSLVERREEEGGRGERGRKVNIEIGRKMELDLDK